MPISQLFKKLWLSAVDHVQSFVLWIKIFQSGDFVRRQLFNQKINIITSCSLYTPWGFTWTPLLCILSLENDLPLLLIFSVINDSRISYYQHNLLSQWPKGISTPLSFPVIVLISSCCELRPLSIIVIKQFFHPSNSPFQTLYRPLANETVAGKYIAKHVEQGHVHYLVQFIDTWGTARKLLLCYFNLLQAWSIREWCSRSEPEQDQNLKLMKVTKAPCLNIDGHNSYSKNCHQIWKTASHITVEQPLCTERRGGVRSTIFRKIRNGPSSMSCSSHSYLLSKLYICKFGMLNASVSSKEFLIQASEFGKLYFPGQVILRTSKDLSSILEQWYDHGLLL